MKKRLIAGDIHGFFTGFSSAYYTEQPDDVIILGDYFDSFSIHPYDQKDCYDSIVKIREEHIKNKKGKFIMLIGNHDMHYMDEKFGRCSGWNPMTCSIASNPLCTDWDAGKLKMCYIDEKNKTIYSHAGVSMDWFNSWIKSKSLGDINTIETKAFCFTYKNGGDYFGSSSYNSPLWIRPEGLMKCPYKDKTGQVWNQVFGHTMTKEPEVYVNNDSKEIAKLYSIDCLHRWYMVETIDDNEIVTKREIVKQTIEYEDE